MKTNEYVTLNLLPSGITATGVTSEGTIIPSGSVDSIQHIRGGGGGGGSVGAAPPTGDGDVVLSGGSGTPVVDEPGGTSSNFSGSLRMRGVACECTSNRTLTEIEVYLNISISTELRFVVYESDTQVGTYTQIHENTISSSGTGQKFYSSGPIAISLQAGKYYVIGSAWQGTVGYYYGAISSPLAFGFSTIDAPIGFALGIRACIICDIFTNDFSG